MKKLLNTLYISQPDRYLALDGENVVIHAENAEIGRIPLHNIDGIITYGYTGASPALMGACAERGISICFLTQSGRFLARVSGKKYGNVLLRKEQYRFSEDRVKSLSIAKCFMIGKFYNSRWVLERTKRDYPMRVDVERFQLISSMIQERLLNIDKIDDINSLRGVEGETGKLYFSLFDDMILQQKEEFYFHERNRRPPLDNVNALLSFAYTLLASMCSAALEMVGLDPYIGFMHTDRPGRMSLALDLMEELRSVYADRFVLTLINRKEVNAKGFIKREDGAVVMDDKSKRIFLTAWQNKKKEKIAHPYLKENVEWGMVPYIQALLLARYIRGDLDLYPPFMWK